MAFSALSDPSSLPCNRNSVSLKVEDRLCNKKDNQEQCEHTRWVYTRTRAYTCVHARVYNKECVWLEVYFKCCTKSENVEILLYLACFGHAEDFVHFRCSFRLNNLEGFV